MKHIALLFSLALLLAACSSSAPPEANTAASEASAQAVTAAATGTVESVNPSAGTITIAHGAVEALHWPPMTMAYKAGHADLRSIKRGDQVSFRFTATGMNGTLLSIQPE